MPRGPKGGKRPADVIGAAVMIGGISSGGGTASPDRAFRSVASGMFASHDVSLSPRARIGTLDRVRARHCFMVCFLFIPGALVIRPALDRRSVTA
jgi:hypothetical protein